MKRLLFLLIVLFSSFFPLQLYQQLEDVQTSEVLYRKDFFYDYLVSKEILSGGDVYQPLPSLTSKELGYKDPRIMTHPTSKPPSIMPILLPLGFFSFYTCSLAWTIMELFLLIWGLRKIFKNIAGINSTELQILGFLLVLGSAPFYYDLVLGQWNVVLLALVVFLIDKAKSGNDTLAGVAIGLMLSIKFFGGLFLLYFLFSERYRIVLSCLLTFTCLMALGVSLIGIESALYYFNSVVPEVLQFCGSDVRNQSLWTIGQRIFSGMEANYPWVLVNSAPLIDFSNLAYPSSFLVVISFAIFSLYTAFRIGIEIFSLALLAGASTIISPVVWVHSTALIIFPLALLYRVSTVNGLNIPKSAIFLMALSIFYIANRINPSLIADNYNLSFLFSLITCSSLILVIITTLVTGNFLLDAKSRKQLPPLIQRIVQVRT